VIRLDGITKSFRDGAARFDVLRGVSLEVADGDFLAIVGASGSGKSTLLNVMGGLDREFGGRAEVAGLGLGKLSDRELARYRNEQVGFVFQSFNLVPPLTALQNVLLPSYFAQGESVAAARGRALAALDRVGLGSKGHRLPSQLSGGERQRVALARALFRKPRLLLADEPTGSLDPDTAQGVIALLRELNERDGLTLVVVTHEERVSSAARRIVRLRDGLLLDDRTPAVAAAAALPER
jgi:putative ABC transport system ATP-binding protein